MTSNTVRVRPRAWTALVCVSNENVRNARQAAATPKTPKRWKIMRAAKVDDLTPLSDDDAHVETKSLTALSKSISSRRKPVTSHRVNI